jgi:carnosine N-methyltransferase
VIVLPDLEEYYDDLDSSSPGPPNHHSHSHDSPSHSHSHDPPSHSHVSPEAKEDSPKSSLPKPTEHEMDKIRSTLKQFVRDWSREVRSWPYLPPYSSRAPNP